MLQPFFLFFRVSAYLLFILVVYLISTVCPCFLSMSFYFLCVITYPWKSLSLFPFYVDSFLCVNTYPWKSLTHWIICPIESSLLLRYTMVPETQNYYVDIFVLMLICPYKSSCRVIWKSNNSWSNYFLIIFVCKY